MGTQHPVRVLHLAPPEQLQSGITTYAENFRRALRSAGGEIDVLTPRPDRPNRVSAIHAYCREAVAEARRGYDVVHAELGAGSLSEFYAALALARQASKVPVCLTLHVPPRAIWWPFHLHFVRERRLLRAAVTAGLGGPARFIDARAVRSSSQVFVFTEAGRRAVANTIGYTGPRVSVIPFAMPGLRPAASPPARDANGAALVIGFFGYWYRSKNIEDLLAAVAMLQGEQPPVRLRLWGVALPGGGRAGAHYRDAVLSALERLRLNGQVELGGWVPEGSVASTLRSCDAIVLPYRTPGRISGLASASSAARDALAAGVPVITTRTEAMSELVRDGDNGLLVEPADHQALVRGLRRLRDDPELRERLVSGASRSAAELAQASPGPAVIAAYRELIG